MRWNKPGSHSWNKNKHKHKKFKYQKKRQRKTKCVWDGTSLVHTCEIRTSTSTRSLNIKGKKQKNTRCAVRWNKPGSHLWNKNKHRHKKFKYQRKRQRNTKCVWNGTSLVHTCEIRTSTSTRSLNIKGKDKGIPSVYEMAQAWFTLVK